MLRQKNIFHHGAGRLSRFFRKFFCFGFSIAFWDLIESQKKRIRWFKEEINIKKHKVILAWLTCKFRDFILCFSNDFLPASPSSSNHIPPYIWTCWWDGIANAPDIVKSCFCSLRENAESYNVQLITKMNFQDFCTIPDYILRKFNAGIISKTHFSDILRMALLSEHGGFWLDSTILVTGPMPRDDTHFFTIKREYGGESVSRQRWTGFCIGGEQNNILFDFSRRFFFEYWKKYNELVDYFLIDYVIAIAYNRLPPVKKMIDEVCPNNPCVYATQNSMDREFDSTLFAAIAKTTTFNKLTWKKDCPSITPDNKITFYGYILDNYRPRDGQKISLSGNPSPNATTA
jgi:hypothetical protein